MESVEQELWDTINSEWCHLYKALRANLPITNYEMFTVEGDVVPSERPMIESIIADKFSKSPALFHYLIAAGIFSPQEQHEITGTTENGGRIIAISAISRIQLKSTSS